MSRCPESAAVALAVVLLAPSPAAATSQTPLARKLSRALAVPHVARAHTSALAVDLATASSSNARNLRLPLIPASNEKLAVTYASLLALGASFRFSTDVLGEGELDGTLWRGDVVLKGYGDPTLSTLDLLSLASQLRSQGIRRVTGQVIGDESFFDAKRMGPGLEAVLLPQRVARALGADGRPRPLQGPGDEQAGPRRRALVPGRPPTRGDLGRGRALTGTADSAAVPLATIESVPLAGVLRFMDHESDNFTAEMLLKQLGAGIGLQGTTAAGAQAVLQLLQEQQIPLTGSGSSTAPACPASTASRPRRRRDAALELARRGPARAPDRRAARRRPERHARLPHARGPSPRDACVRRRGR
jgi:D-alanyl-D-alanine carboxypeptidase/D-alanyl-D-alanine-endopeptidase (penicillin-binding protein 4)